MNAEVINSHELDDDEFDTLEELLTSQAVPADCMDVEMLDGYLAALLLSPKQIEARLWLPGVWSADADEAVFSSGSKAQQAIHLVLRYYNELVTTLGLEEGWEPFCYAGSGHDGDLGIGDEWIEGFAQGLELWPEGWDDGVSREDADAVQDAMEALMSPWENEEAGYAGDQIRLQWLDAARTGVKTIYRRWREAGIPAPQIIPVELPAVPSASPVGRNELCPCGSGEKFKKCCGNQ